MLQLWYVQGNILLAGAGRSLTLAAVMEAALTNRGSDIETNCVIRIRGGLGACSPGANGGGSSVAAAAMVAVVLAVTAVAKRCP